MDNLWLGIEIILDLGKVGLFILQIIPHKIYLELQKPPLLTQLKVIQEALLTWEKLYQVKNITS